MTAYDDAPTLDALLRTTAPVEDEPVDLGALLDALIDPDTNPGPLSAARNEIARYVNSLRVDLDRARGIAVALESEVAHLRATIAAGIGTLRPGDDDACSARCLGVDAVRVLREGTT